MIDKRDLCSLEIVIIHVCINDLRTKRNLGNVMGEVYAFVDTAKRKFPKNRLFLSGGLRRRDVSWRRIGVLNDRYDCLGNALVPLVDPNALVEDGHFARLDLI